MQQRKCKEMTMEVWQISVFLSCCLADSLAEIWGSTQETYLPSGGCAAACANVKSRQQRNTAAGYPDAFTAEGIPLNLSLRLSGLTPCAGKPNPSDILLCFLASIMLANLPLASKESKQSDLCECESNSGV